MDDFRRSPNKQLEDPEYQIMRAMIAARTEAGMTHHELSKRTVINLSNLSRIENGNPSPHFFASHPHREKLSIPFDRCHRAGAERDPSPIAG